MIRKITPSDKQEWLRLRQELWPDDLQEHAREIDKFFAGNGFNVVDVLVLEREQNSAEVRLGGFIELNFRSYAEGSLADKVPFVEGWYVDPDLRGSGLGARLIQAAEQWALDNGFEELASDAELDNTASIAAHKALGFEETDRVVCFLKKLQKREAGCLVK